MARNSVWVACNQLKLKCVGVRVPKVGDSVCETNNMSKCVDVWMDAYIIGIV